MLFLSGPLFWSYMNINQSFPWMTTTVAKGKSQVIVMCTRQQRKVYCSERSAWFENTFHSLSNVAIIQSGLIYLCFDYLRSQIQYLQWVYPMNITPSSRTERASNSHLLLIRYDIWNTPPHTHRQWLCITWTHNVFVAVESVMLFGSGVLSPVVSTITFCFCHLPLLPCRDLNTIRTFFLYGTF